MKSGKRSEKVVRYPFAMGLTRNLASTMREPVGEEILHRGPDCFLCDKEALIRLTVEPSEGEAQ